MTGEDVQTYIKVALKEFLPTEANKALWGVSKQIASKASLELREKLRSEKKNSAASNITDKMQEFMDNPMSDEEESKALRALLHVGLSSGELSPQLLDKLDKIIGVSAGKDEIIEPVDFKDAFPSYAEAIRMCGTTQPKICECGGIIK